MSKFPERLSEFMLFYNDMTTDQLGKALGIGGSTIRLWKTGKRTPSLNNLVRLADYFSCSLDYLLGRSEHDIKFTPSRIPPFYDHFVSILKERGISWYKVAQDTQLSKSNIQDWRDGRRPLLPTLLDLADYLDISLDFLVGRE